jgi:hypothetical protein
VGTLDIDEIESSVRDKNQKDQCKARGTEVFEKWPEKGHFSWCALSF